MNIRFPKDGNEVRMRIVQRQPKPRPKIQPPASSQAVTINFNTQAQTEERPKANSDQQADIDEKTIDQLWKLLEDKERRITYEDGKSKIALAVLGIIVPIFLHSASFSERHPDFNIFLAVYGFIVVAMFIAQLFVSPGRSFYDPREIGRKNVLIARVTDDKDKYTDELLESLSDPNKLATKLANETYTLSTVANKKRTILRFCAMILMFILCVAYVVAALIRLHLL